MKDLLLQDGDTLDLQATGTLELQNLGNPTVSPVPIITPGSLGAAAYPSFFPCPSWEFSQDIVGHLGRTLFDSGWVRQRRTWREQNTGVNMAFIMPTDMFDRWSMWMVNNGYEWFTMYLDRFAGEKVLAEVRLVAPIQWEYDAYDNVIARVSGELGETVHDYGPQDGPLEGENDFGNFCVPVFLTDVLQDTTAYVGDVIVLAVDFNEDATTPVAFAWFEDNVLIPGETGPSLTYTIPQVGDITQEQQVIITVNVSNDCGSVWSTSIITIPPDPACIPYACSALIDEMAAMSALTGAGTWDLLDPNFAPDIPQYFREVAPFSQGGRLTSDATGENWGSSQGLSRTTQTVDDADLCEGPYIMSNDDDPESNEFSLVGRPLWGSRLPNVSLAIVARGVDRGPLDGDPDNYIFRGACGVMWWDQTVTMTGSIEHTIRIGYKTVNSTPSDIVSFNSNYAAFRWDATFSDGTFSGTTPKLIQVLLAVDDVSYIPSETQSYFYASYDMMVTLTYQVWVTDSATGTTEQQSQSVTGRILQCFSRETTDPVPGQDMPESHKPRSDDGTNTCYYLQGGWGGFYNLSLNHVFGGEESGALFEEGGYSPGVISSNLDLAFNRNYSDYTEPGYCSLPENRRASRRRT